MRHLGLFEGIGGFSLAARWMGWETVSWCEWNEFGQKVLRHHFPEAEGHGDITKTDFTKYANTIDILTGGFPCQPYSQAGKRKGKDDERHLWPEMLRAIREIQPVYVVGENVRGLTNWNGGLVFDEVQADLENEGYEVLPFLLPACAVNAPHRRDRIWFIAYAERNRDKRTQSGSNGEKEAMEKIDRKEYCTAWQPIGTDSRNNERSNKVGYAAYTNADSDGRERSDSEHEVNTGERRVNVFHDFKQIYNDTDTSNQRLQGCEINGSIGSIKPNRDKQLAGLLPPDWKEFPIESPLCGGNDGLPRELDGITFSKWRQESIKAYGNAIVPQVALQIFKAIEQMEILNQTNS